MVLESILNIDVTKAKSMTFFNLGILYSSIAVLLSLWIFESYASLVMIFLTVFAAIPMMYKAIQSEEEKDFRYEKELFRLKDHSATLWKFTALFLGITVSLAVWYILLPAETVSTVFSVQQDTYMQINGQVTSYDHFAKIFFNNLRVLIFCIAFAFFYGAGAIFIMTWNAGVIAVAIGSFVRGNLEQFAAHLGMAKVAGYLSVVSIGFLKYTLHGIPEIFAYFVGGLAGGIISAAVIKHDFGTKKYEAIVLDSSVLIIAATAIIFIAALLEVYITPVVF